MRRLSLCFLMTSKDRIILGKCNALFDRNKRLDFLLKSDNMRARPLLLEAYIFIRRKQQMMQIIVQTLPLRNMSLGGEVYYEP